MKTKMKIFAGALLFACSCFLIPTAQAENNNYPKMPGMVEGSGTHFEITDSEYLNITLESSEKIEASLESKPKIIILKTEAVGADAGHSSSQLTISGLEANFTYHKYTDDLHNHQPTTANENGVVSFSQDVSQNHLIFIQPEKSTKFIKDDSTGGDCSAIGNWDVSSKTCLLSEDVFETIQIDNDGIILDGDGHVVGANFYSSGVYVSNKKNVTINNINSSAIRLNKVDGARVSDSIVRSSNNGISLVESKNSIISGNTIIYSGHGLHLHDNQADGNNIIENNKVLNSSFAAIHVYSDESSVLLKNNTVQKSGMYGIFIFNSRNAKLRGNTISDCGRGALSVRGNDSDTHDIDESNLVGGRPFIYKKNISNETFDGISNVGAFFCANCDNVAFKNIVVSDGGPEIGLWHTNNSLIENITNSDESMRLQMSDSSNNTIKGNDINVLGISDSNDNEIYGNNFFSSSPIEGNYYSSGNVFSLDLPVGGNYWQSNRYCNDSDSDGFCDYRFTIDRYKGLYDYHPLVEEVERDSSESSCCSSVMFLPGHQASRLYREGIFGEDQLWEPTNRNQDVEQLFLDESGKSVDPDIYTRDIINSIYGGVKDSYKTFSESMDQFSSSGMIEEWKPVPYDWRMPLEEIVDDGVALESGDSMDIVAELERMAAASKTGKVTLVGHSNGGLLGKTLMDKLEEEGKEALVDKLILVASPQVGTPKAVSSLLHGDGTELLYGIISDSETGRAFGENMISAYNLLPSEEYFDVVETPVVEFDENVKNIYDFRSIYGENIDSYGEFKKFVLGDDGARSEPPDGDLNSSNVLKEPLMSRAETTHQKLDSWQPPEDLEVVQIAGWGLDTIAGVKYSDCDSIFCFGDDLNNLRRELILKTDGDSTVVVPSAVEMGGDAMRYYLNVSLFNKDKEESKDHASIFEVEPLQNFIKNIIQNNEDPLTDYITAEKPEVQSEDKRLRFRLHSPVKLDIFDEKGNHTGLVNAGQEDPDFQIAEEKIPNSYYFEAGETKYAGSGEYAEKIILTGEDLGTFTFDIDQVAGDQITSTTTFSDIPTAKNMKAELNVSEEGIVSEMKIDIEGDGTVDLTLGAGKEIGKEDQLRLLKKIIKNLDVDSTVKNRLAKKIDNAMKQIEKSHTAASNAMLENVIQQINIFSDDKKPEKFRISEEEAEKLINIIKVIMA